MPQNGGVKPRSWRGDDLDAVINNLEAESGDDHDKFENSQPRFRPPRQVSGVFFCFLFFSTEKDIQNLQNLP